MLDRSRLTRLITMALASCAVTWALAGAALARTDSPGPQSTTNAPAYNPAVADNDKGTINARPPAFRGFAGDTDKVPDREIVDRNIASLGHGGKAGPVTAVNTGDDDTGTIALILSIAAILTALGAMTLSVIRPRRSALGA
jgi:hypothetical protein